MERQYIIDQLEANKQVFAALFSNVERHVYEWKPQQEKWNLLEILCHLYDEEREDFRARIKHIMHSPGEPMPPIDPPGWVTQRNYVAQDYHEKLNTFLAERDTSVNWLRSLTDTGWRNEYHHPKLGMITPGMLLNNWLAHDYLHFRQITRTKYQYLTSHTGSDLSYAGEW